MIKKIAIILIVLAIAAVMILFTDRNPGQLSLDLAFGVVEPSIAMAISVTFVAGWLFGLLCTCLFIMRLMNERRRLRNALRHAESEVSRMRSLPLADAD
jgi:lipopolysaccharide assembly protein A